METGQPGAPVRRKYPIVVIGRADGLPSGQIHSLITAGRGQVWFATPNGLAHYDGVRTSVLTRADGLSTHGLRCVTMTHDGDVWVGGDVGLDRVTRDGRVDPLVGGWSFGLVDDVASTLDGSVLAASAAGLVVRQQNSGWQLESDPRVHHLLRCVAVDESASGVWWAASATNGLLRRGEDGAWGEPEENDWKAAGLITSLAVQPGGSLLVAGDDGVVHVDRSGRTVRPIDGVNGGVTAVWAGDSELWVGAGGRLLMMRNHQGRWVLADEVLTDIRVNRVSRDLDGTIWVATDGIGAVRIEGIRDVIDRPDIAGLGAVFSVRRGAAGDFLLGGDQGAARLTADRAPIVTHLDELSDRRCWDLLEGDDGVLWAATDSGLLRVDEGPPSTIARTHPVLGAPGRVLLRADDALMVGTLAGLAVIEDDNDTDTDRVDAEPPILTIDDDGTSLGYVYTLEQGVDVVWVGTLGNGLWLVDGGRPRRVLGDGLIATGNTYAVACRQDGSAVVIQDDRIIDVAADEQSSVLNRSTEALAGWALVLGDDDIYVGGSSGLRRLDARTGEELLHCTIWMGLDGWEFTTSRSLLRDGPDRIMCGLNSGLATVQLPGLHSLAAGRPDVEVSEITWSNTTPELRSGVYEVSVGNWSVDISVRAVWPLREAGIQFRHRLLGFETAWHEPDEVGRIRFGSLPPGRYTVEAQVRSPLARWGPARELATIRVVNKTWRQQLQDGPLTRRGRLRQRLAQENHALEQRVRERTLELARAGDELRRANRDLTALSFTDALTGLANRRSFDDALHASLEAAQTSHRPLALLLIDVDEFKAFNDSEGHLAGDNCLRMIGSLMREVVAPRADIVARYGGEEFAALLSDNDVDAAAAVGEQLRLALLARAIEHRAATSGDVVTVSVGVAAVTLARSGDHSDAHLLLIHRADRALYSAKFAGRNCVVAAADDSAP